MGMAASQARYLGLTARKTNVEYEGQQVNQARTALANQSANTFNELLALEVPTAPSTQDYTTLQYSYEDGAYSEVITNMTEITDDPDYNYLVTHYHYSDVFTGVQNTRPNPQVILGSKSVKNDMTGVVYDDQIADITDDAYFSLVSEALDTELKNNGYDTKSEAEGTIYSSTVTLTRVNIFLYGEFADSSSEILRIKKLASEYLDTSAELIYVYLE